MDITVKKTMTSGALLKEIFERRCGHISMQGHDCFDRPSSTTIPLELFEKMADEFAAHLRAHWLEEGNKR